MSELPPGSVNFCAWCSSEHLRFVRDATYQMSTGEQLPVRMYGCESCGGIMTLALDPRLTNASSV